MYKKISILFFLAIFLISSGFGCKISNKATREAMKPITLNYWRVFDGSDDFQEIIAKYKALHPFITINYRKLRYEEYENTLLNAFAEDRGPDIFSIHNTWMKKYQSKLAPLPPTITMAYPVVKGSIKKEVVPELRTVRSINTTELKNKFVDVVSHDVVLDGKIYGLPLFVDTLAMYYNRDLFNNAGISQVPKYWNREFLQDIKKLSKQDQQQNIIQSGVALGGSSNINRFSDIISVLMMQNGAIMMNDDNQIMFNRIPNNSQNNNYNPGLEALRFYTDFSNPLKESYSWNKNLPNSLDMFIDGNLAIMFSYSYDLPIIKSRAPKLNFSVAKLPQIEGNPPTNINFANYWVEVVSKKSAHPNEAWDFIQFITKEAQAKSYLKKTKHPTALRSLIASQKNDNDIGVFVDQVLTSKSWYKGKNPQAADTAIKEMVDTVVKNTNIKLKDVINNTATKIQQTIN